MTIGCDANRGRAPARNQSRVPMRRHQTLSKPSMGLTPEGRWQKACSGSAGAPA
eukprot:CAMPEP_0202112624 /NCGR_PEP_ID=MMETSP0965-20130614/32042_1 /ASSEMBLY_ACC=CAM_ASM_000507 /TAXON_ID=4773 /ORGANISM="Schizochytrium aggregatum, Strain ATCC28209" /LENGTH=53 /DNA_ID=CAMNT_0048682199 /DNA_START=13 /DNA_END=170 /DNA_ORIENTATION=-